MDLWYEEHFDELQQKIITEFTYLFHKYEKKGKNIYAVSIKANEDCIFTQIYITYLESLKKQHYQRKWLPEKWIFSVDDGIFADDFLDDFTKKIKKYYGENIVPKYQINGNIEKEVNDNINFFIAAMKAAKAQLIKELDAKINDIVFILTVDEHPDIASRSAIEINAPSVMLQEFIDFKNNSND